MQSYWEKVSRDTIIIQGEGFKGYNHYTGRRFQGIQSYWEKVSRDTGIQSLYRELRFQGIQSLYRELRFQGIQSY